MDCIFQCFNVKNFVRIVLTLPEQEMREACARIQKFCERHFAQPPIPELDEALKKEAYILDGIISSSYKDQMNESRDEMSRTPRRLHR